MKKKFGSFTIWIPLQDTNTENGAIRVIEGSHIVENNLRAPSLPVAFEKDRLSFDGYLKTLEMACRCICV
ncbi:MAG: phytanoyl-CoA dioxygenase family protein [Chitinophagales bacterium]